MLSLLDRSWRVLGTGLAFAALFGGGAVMALTAFPLVHLLTPAGPQRRGRNQYVIHLLFRGYVAALKALGLLELHLQGAEKLRAEGGRMIVANHPSLLDVVFIMALVPRSQCIVKRALWDNRFLGRVMRGAGYIPNDLEPDALLEACRASIAQGECLIIFPEGTRTTPGEPMKFQRGFAQIATALELPIQIVTITCVPPTLVKGEKWWNVPARRPRFQVLVGATIDAGLWAKADIRSLATRKLVRYLENFYAEQLANGQSRARDQRADCLGPAVG